MKIINIKLFAFCLAALATTSCSKEAIVIDISFSASPATAKVGDPITFLVGYGAESYALYTGDAGHDFANSTLQLVGADVANTEYKPEDGFATGFSFKSTKADEDIEYTYVYSEAGTYTATLVAAFVGRKQYEGDGYQSDRVNTITENEYDIERQIKTVTITITE